MAKGRSGAGYSGTPLVRKLGIRPGARAAFPGAPDGFREGLGELPDGVQVLARSRAPLDFLLLFVRREAELRRRLPALAATLAADGMLWIAWPKKSSGVATDLSFDAVQRAGLGTGLVDTKICAVDEVWSGLKFVIRLADRPGRS